jgi:hypothetical protein
VNLFLGRHVLLDGDVEFFLPACLLRLCLHQNLVGRVQFCLGLLQLPLDLVRLAPGRGHQGSLGDRLGM